MNAMIEKLLTVAEGEVGYLEKATNASLYSQTANAGSGNFTKYAYELDAIPGFYNGKKNGYAWCDVFVDWCFVQAFGADEAKRLLCQPDKSLGAGCLFSARYYQQNGQFHKTPMPGDQIFFGSEGAVSHTGIVHKVDDKRVYTIEGNTSGASGVVPNGGGVCMKSYSLTSGSIYGYGRPAYEGEESAEPVVPDCDTAPTVRPKLEGLPLLRKGSEGETVRAVQIILIGNGISCGKHGDDGEFGEDTENAVEAYQEDMGLEADGIVGPETYAALMGLRG